MIPHSRIMGSLIAWLETVAEQMCAYATSEQDACFSGVRYRFGPWYIAVAIKDGTDVDEPR